MYTINELFMIWGTLREQKRERERQKIVSFLGDVTTFGLCSRMKSVRP